MANMDGSEKLSLLMIGKSTTEWCFKNMNTKTVTYESSKKVDNKQPFLKKTQQYLAKLINLFVY